MITVDKNTFDAFTAQKLETYGEITTSLYTEEGRIERITCYVDGLQVIAIETRDLQTGEIVYEINSLDQEVVF